MICDSHTYIPAVLNFRQRTTATNLRLSTILLNMKNPQLMHNVKIPGGWSNCCMPKTRLLEVKSHIQ